MSAVRSLSACTSSGHQLCPWPVCLASVLWHWWWQVCSLNWNTVNRTQFLSASWDDTIKLWDSEQPHSLRTFAEHTYCIYAAVWWVMFTCGLIAAEQALLYAGPLSSLSRSFLDRNPGHADVFLSASGDNTAKIWDVRQPRSTQTITAHQNEVKPVPLFMTARQTWRTALALSSLLLLPQVLAADWCKYNDCVFATGSVDKSIKTWDVRMPQREVATLLGHTYAVRRCAPNKRWRNLRRSRVTATSSCDMKHAKRALHPRA